jgi:methionyl-tRNA formyltransferase
MSDVRVVYFGTPAYAVPALIALANDERFEVILTVTQPDRPAGRGHRLTAPPVKEAAIELGMPVYQPSSLRSGEARQPLVDADADLFVVAAFGLIFGEKTLSIPRCGAVNLHASLLPAYRGANPIAAAIASGDERTGVSLMVMERGLDSGPVIASRSLAITPDDTTGSLTSRLGELGALLLLEAIGGYLDGTTRPVPQLEEEVTIARSMRKSDGEIDWSLPAEQVERHIRAMWPWPRAWARLGDATVQIHAAEVADSANSEMRAPGTMRIEGADVFVSCEKCEVKLNTVQFSGKSAIPAKAAVAGGQLADGMRFESAPADREPLVKRPTSGSATTA